MTPNTKNVLQSDWVKARTSLNSAQRVVLSTAGLTVSLITVVMTAFESLRPDWTRRKRGERSHQTHGLKVLPYWDTFTGPIYVPEHDREVIGLLIARDIPQLVTVLEHRASLGSGWASALLAYLEAMGVLREKPDLAAAISRSTAAAQAGDSYAQYVLAWALWDTGDRVHAVQWMKRSVVDGKFLPARVGFGVIAYMLGWTKRETRGPALRILWQAHRLGHAQPLQLICRFACRGHFGIVYRLLGLLAYPFVLARSNLIVWLHPFSERSFMWYPPEMQQIIPFFRSEKRAAASPPLEQSMPEAAVAPQPVSPENPREVEGRVAGGPGDHKALGG
jgi:hypothetical protein